MDEIVSKKFKVEKVIYYNASSKWGALGVTPIDELGNLEFELANDFGSITVAGNFENVYEKATIVLTGSIVSNPKYGKQIQVKSLSVLADATSAEGIKSFLRDSFIKGISTQHANQIYNKFKKESLEIVLNHTNRLLEIPGIGKKTVEKVLSSIGYYKERKEFFDFCSNLGMRFRDADKIIDSLGKDNALHVVKTNPYTLLEKVPSLNFKQVDEIFLKQGGSPTDRKRLHVGFLHVLRSLAVFEGSTGCFSKKVKAKFFDLLSLTQEQLYEATVQELVQEDKIEFGRIPGQDGGIIYYKEYVDIEKDIAGKIKSLTTNNILSSRIKPDIVEEEIKDFPFTLNKQQVAAVHDCLKKNVAVLTGAGGCLTGDTIIKINRGYTSKEVTLKRLYEALSKKYIPGVRHWNINVETKVRSFIEEKGVIKLNTIKKVVYSGKKKVYEIKLDDGKTLKATAKHEIMTKEGFKELQLLTTSDYVMIDSYATGEVAPGYSKVASITPLGEEDTYDICCYKNHNFNANGMIVHNSGKSSITKALYNIYNRCGYHTVLLAPTAKACRRLEECTGGEALTIHKYLGMTGDGEVWGPGIPVLEDTVYIIDEASMLDIILFRGLLKFVTPTSRVLLVGDNNQLPSVQAGNVLGDLIFSGKVHVSVLTDIMRQKENSNIIKFSSMTNNGEIFEPCSYVDFHYEEFGTGDELRDFFLKRYLEEVGNYGINQVQVITPYKRGEVSMNNLNKFLQASYNKDGEILIEPFKMGDRVRHTRNNYKKDVYNGETGIITDFQDNNIIVDYGDKFVSYTEKDLDELTLSYVATVHASQGSEYAVCFVILDDSATNDYLFIRRLLYTAITRGKKKVYILSKPYLVDRCIVNANYRPRITKLKDFMQGKVASVYN